MPEPTPTDGLPYSQAAANNREPILAELRRLLAACRSVIEIGAGTGQHALHFAGQLPHLRWQATEHPGALATLRLRFDASPCEGLPAPIALDITARPWAIESPGAFYTANTLHIVSQAAGEDLFAGASEASRRGTRLLAYGPFNYRGRFTSESNERFDGWLRERDPASGIRDVEWADRCARDGGFELLEDIAMPANNRLLCWERS